MFSVLYSQNLLEVKIVNSLNIRVILPEYNFKTYLLDKRNISIFKILNVFKYRYHRQFKND